MLNFGLVLGEGESCVLALILGRTALKFSLRIVCSSSIYNLVSELLGLEAMRRIAASRRDDIGQNFQFLLITQI